jgi:acetyl esterase/lipase
VTTLADSPEDARSVLGTMWTFRRFEAVRASAWCGVVEIVEVSINGEADVLRDEGEAYANKLREAGVPVTAIRYQGMIHDFVMLNTLRDTHAADAAIKQAIVFLSQALGPH